MKPFCLVLLLFFIPLSTHACCNSDVLLGYQVTVPVPTDYTSSPSFHWRAFLLETNQAVPTFRAALSVEATTNHKYSCTLDVFLGDLKVWSSGHLSPFYTTEKCTLHLTQDGDLHLKGQNNEQIGWRAGTSGQGVERLQLLKTGNLVLVDALNLIKWQSFNFPTNIMLWGQRLSSDTRITSFPDNSTWFYSFEIQDDKIALYLNSDSIKYSYWEFQPDKNRNITFVELDTKGLVLFSGKHGKIAEIQSQKLEPIRFLAIGKNTGNLGLYYYSTVKQSFEASFQALNSTCDLPLACKSYGICTFANACSCIRLVTGGGDGSSSDCSSGTVGACGENQAEMLELQGVTSVLKSSRSKVNVSKERCSDLCLQDCDCTAAVYSSSSDTNIQECFVYGMVIGVKQVERRSSSVSSSYMVKVPKGTNKRSHGKGSGLRKWILVVVLVADGLILLLVLGGLVYYFIRRRIIMINKNHSHEPQVSTSREGG